MLRAIEIDVHDISDHMDPMRTLMMKAAIKHTLPSRHFCLAQRIAQTKHVLLSAAQTIPVVVMITLNYGIQVQLNGFYSFCGLGNK